MSVEAAIIEGQLITNALPEVYINVVISAMSEADAYARETIGY